MRAEAALVATFEGYPPGLLGTSFTESHSGIVFTNPVYVLGPNQFVANYADPGPPFNLSPVLPSTILTVAALGSGQSLSLGGRAGFTATFPLLTPSVEMDVLYASFDGPANLTITGFSSANQQVAQTTFVLPASTFTFKHEIFNSPIPLQRIVVVPTGLAVVTGYDNISIPVPEPTTATMLLLGMLGCGWRRR
jgi:hypothetical protein